jgi:hypothetical protein
LYAATQMHVTRRTRTAAPSFRAYVRL